MLSFNVHTFRFICGLFSHSSIVHDQITIAYYVIVIPEMSRAASTSGTIKVSLFEQNFDVPLAFNEKKQPEFFLPNKQGTL